MKDLSNDYQIAMANAKSEKKTINKQFVVALIAQLLNMIGLSKAYPLIMISLGHEIKVDPGTTNINNRFDPNRFTSEVFLVRRVYESIKSFIVKKFRKSIVILPDVSLSYTIGAINKICADRGNARDICIELHTDINNGHNTEEILLVYASQKGFNFAKELESRIKEVNPTRVVIIRHASTGFVSRPGFLYQTSCTALICEIGCIDSTADQVSSLSADLYNAINKVEI